MPELEQFHLAREYQHLHEHRFDLWQKAAPEGSQHVMVVVGVAATYHRGQVARSILLLECTPLA